MLDITVKEFDELYYVNEKLFRSVSNWFYFKNDKKASSLATRGYVCYGRNRGRTKSFGFPEDDYGGLVLLCRSDKININKLREKCAAEKGNIVRFELKDGTLAHYGIIRDAIGVWGSKNEEYPLLIIPNKPQTKKWPYSLKGNTTYDKASKEEGTIAYDVATGVIEKLLPDQVMNNLGFDL